ncbi:MAG: hypothetical protein Faunusvirus13_7 [Faunusvirus sp.]|jgi:hypothetical protein|uniref:Uncharacterized protein n=1 Tax=Faunusvirus sp. TaxID=2487766 RepID=A0A3G4ZYL7_9VIRU|nr:MAG: hypothetical protein Faunusvirus13_7 [Faunusvirus sp.]
MNAHRDEFVSLVCKYDEIGCLEYIDKYDDFYDAVMNNYCRQNMLQLTCTYKLTKVAIALIDRKCDLTHQNSDGFSALMYANYYGLLNVTKYIIDKCTDYTTRTTRYGLSEMMYLCNNRDATNVIKMIDRGYDIYYKNVDDRSLFTTATKFYFRNEQIIKKLIDIDTNFIKEFNTIYDDPKHKKDELYYDIAKYCTDKRDAYKCEIIVTMNDKSTTNALYQSFHTTYAVGLVDVICDFLISRKS